MTRIFAIALAALALGCSSPAGPGSSYCADPGLSDDAAEAVGDWGRSLGWSFTASCTAPTVAIVDADPTAWAAAHGISRPADGSRYGSAFHGAPEAPFVVVIDAAGLRAIGVPVSAFVRHELGHVLGAGHTEEGIMAPAWNAHSRNCIDAVAAREVGGVATCE
jgi:hypothetical protein